MSTSLLVEKVSVEKVPVKKMSVKKTSRWQKDWLEGITNNNNLYGQGGLGLAVMEELKSQCLTCNLDVGAFSPM